MTLQWDALCEVLRSGEQFLLTSHVRPDCDALGSELALAGILEALGKTVSIVNADATPANIQFIDPNRKIKILGTDCTLESLPEHDVFVVLDTSAWVQLGAMADAMKASAAKKIVIDHHVSSDDLGATEFKDTESEATGRLITDLAGHLGVELSPEISMPLFAALMTDTGWLRFSSVKASSYQCAAKLIEGGASATWVYGQLYEQDTLARHQLRSRVCGRMTDLYDGRLIHMYCLNQDFEDLNAQRTDTEDCVNQGLRVKGTEVSFIIVEQPDGRFKGSLRSRGSVDVSKVAEQFGGGGHKAAAGTMIDGPLAEAQTALIEAIAASL